MKQGIYEFLKENHVGKENAVYSKALEQRFSLSDRGIRRVISALRKEGCPICSGCKGYYLGKTQKETEKTAAWLNDLASGIADAGKSMEQIAAEKADKPQIIIIVKGVEDMEALMGLFPEKEDLAVRLIHFFEENDTHDEERAKEVADKERILAEAMQMLDSGLLMRAILEVMERVEREETNYLKKNNYRRLLDDLYAFYNRKAWINSYEEAKRHAERNCFCR